MPLDGETTDHEDPFAQFNGPSSAILFPVGERKVGWETRKGTYERINSHKAIIRLTQDGTAVHVLSVVGDGYKLVHNRELYSRVEDTMRKQVPDQDLQDVRVTDRVSGWGKTCFREYVFPNIKCYVGGQSKSSVAFRLIVQNGYGGSALRVHAGAIEFWCTNGIIAGDFTSTYRKHTSRLEVQGIDAAVKNAFDTFATSQVKWKEWAHKPVQHAAAMELFREIAASTKLQEGLQQQYLREQDERGPNLWAVYSALTYYASHNDGPFSLRSSVEQMDSTASIMLQRELSVAQWIKTDAWKKLEDA